VLALLAEAWPYAVALAVGLTLGRAVGGWKAVPLAACLTLVAAVAAYGVLTLAARGGQAKLRGLLGDPRGRFPFRGVDRRSRPSLAMARVAWGVPAMVGAVVGAVLRGYGGRTRGPSTSSPT
jgi:hypothetical protein